MFDSKTPLERMIWSGGMATLPPVSFAAPPARRFHGWGGIAKRAIDVAGAVLGCLCFASVGPFIALLIRLETPGPVLFRQVRIGLDGTAFRMWKFRTMHLSATEETGLNQARRGDPRVTRVGAWLRRLSIDELPQFLNVLVGEMSLVGPRPHAPGTCAGGRPFEQVTWRYAARHRVRPGMTGLAQVRGWRGETETEDKLLHRVESDLEYIENWSFWLDFAILARTLWVVLRGENAY
jgi:exopolysaccharide biosynthesis polyprenyl glycosylphosphotransferase